MGSTKTLTRPGSSGIHRSAKRRLFPIHPLKISGLILHARAIGFRFHMGTKV